MKTKVSRSNYRLVNVPDINAQGDPKILRMTSLGNMGDNFSFASRRPSDNDRPQFGCEDVCPSYYYPRCDCEDVCPSHCGTHDYCGCDPY